MGVTCVYALCMPLAGFVLCPLEIPPRNMMKIMLAWALGHAGVQTQRVLLLTLLTRVVWSYVRVMDVVALTAGVPANLWIKAGLFFGVVFLTLQ
jgi:hypothetical protein